MAAEPVPHQLELLDVMQALLCCCPFQVTTAGFTFKFSHRFQRSRFVPHMRVFATRDSDGKTETYTLRYTEEWRDIWIEGEHADESVTEAVSRSDLYHQIKSKCLTLFHAAPETA